MRRDAALALVVAGAVAFAGCFGGAPNAPPVVSARASLDSVAVGDEVIFTGTAVDPDGSVVRFAWDFTSDGTADFVNATRGTATFRFALPGAYTATFTATDEDGASASTSVHIAVVARFRFMADWGSQAGFTVECADTLDPHLIEVTATPAGVAATRFNLTSGLFALNATTYQLAISAQYLERYNVIRLEASYNGTPSGSRSFRAVPFFGSENDTSVVYRGTVEDARVLPNSTNHLVAVGQLAAASVGERALLDFAGTGSSEAALSQQAATEADTYEFDGLWWNHSLNLTTAAFAGEDYHWHGVGVLTTNSSGGLPSVLNLTEFEGSRYRGDLDFLRAEGSGTFGSPGTPSGGTINYTMIGNTTVAAVDGQGASRPALYVRAHYHYNGTLGGAAYDEVNDSQTLQATSDTLYNTALYASWNTTGFVGPTSLTNSGSRFLDSDGNGLFNPDARPALPYDGQYFVGLSPAELQPGDAFLVRNAQGASLRLVAGGVRSEVLSAQGFATAAVEVVTVAGQAAAGADARSFTADVVASGPHNLLRLHWRVSVASPTGSYSADFTLHARGA